MTVKHNISKALEVSLDDPSTHLLSQILTLGERAIEQLKHRGERAAVARLRGSGPGVSFRQAVETWEAQHPIELAYPFEDNDRVGGAIWPGTLTDPGSSNAMMKLRWESRANDLPMHSHEHSDRCIIVLEGRGFFHVSDEQVDRFTGEAVKTTAARERDVFVFTRGVVHTFSTFDYPMVLLSCHLPFINLDDSRQYVLPRSRWSAAERLSSRNPSEVMVNGWAELVVQENGQLQQM